MTSKILDRFAKMSLVCHFFDLIGPSITFLLLRSSICPRAKPVQKLGSKSSKHHKKKKAKVAEKEKEKPKKRKASISYFLKRRMMKKSTRNGSQRSTQAK